MVRRASADSHSVASGLAASRQRDDELARAQGRGSTALRDASGNVLQMNADSPYPLLRPMGVDGSMAFAPDGTVKIISPDTLEDRNMTVRDVASSGRMDAGFVGAQNMGAKVLGVGTVNAARYTAGPVNVDGNGILTPGIGVGGRADVGRLTCGVINIDPNGIAAPGKGITTDPNGAMYSKDYWGGTFHGVLDQRPSAAATKTDIQDVSGLLNALNAIPWKKYRYRDDVDPDRIDSERERLGPMAEDMAAQPALAPFVTYDEETGAPAGYDLGSLVGALGKAVAELTTQVADLRRRVEQRPTAKYPWEPGWSPFG